jgi:hypothetical protein
MKTLFWQSQISFIGLASSIASASAAKGQAPEIRVERDIVYGKGDGMELQLSLALPKTGKGSFPDGGLHSRRRLVHQPAAGHGCTSPLFTGPTPRITTC